MKYSIITPTHNRPELLKRSIDSVIVQNHNNWELIIVNDSPEADYNHIEKYIKDLNDSRIKYFKNPKNRGVNFTRNFGLENTEENSNYIIYLDDDDFLYSDALENINQILKEEKHNWLVTNRAYENKKLVNIKGKEKKKYNYFFDAILFKNFSGDVTHTIESKLAKRYKFDEDVIHGEEWTYFIQLPSEINYHDINTTNTDGYLEGGLTDKLKSKYKENTKLLWKKSKNLKTFLILVLRELNSFFKK